MPKKILLSTVWVLGFIAGPTPDLWSCDTLNAPQEAPPSEPHQQGCGVCHCPPSSDPVACMWNPPLYPCPTHQELPSCECIAMTCHGEISIIGGDTKFYADVYVDNRPDGTCSEIPCGKCFEWGSRLCGNMYDCRNLSGGDDCNPTLGCKNRFIREDWKTAWWKVDADCCQDIQ